MTINDTVQITVGIDDTVTRDLCNDFTPNITNTTCTDTLFETSEKVDFITIANQTMLLKPTTDDEACYRKVILICFSKTYQLTISALNGNDHTLIMDKRFAITVQGNTKEENTAFIVIFVVTGSVVACAISSCLKDLFLRLRSGSKHECAIKLGVASLNITSNQFSNGYPNLALDTDKNVQKSLNAAALDVGLGFCTYIYFASLSFIIYIWPV